MANRNHDPKKTHEIALSGLLFALVIGASMLFSIPGVKRSGQPVRALRWMSWLAVLLPLLVHVSWSVLYHYHSQLAYE